MKITQYSTELNEEKMTILVKENCSYCPEITDLCGPLKIYDLMNHLYNARSKTEEYVWLIALNTKCKPLGIFEVSHGTINSSALPSREIFIKLCLCGAVNFVIAHNHPSGDATPSGEDIDVTRKLNDAGKLMGIKMMDHIIIGDDWYYSFREHDLILI